MPVLAVDMVVAAHTGGSRTLTFPVPVTEDLGVILVLKKMVAPERHLP